MSTLLKCLYINIMFSSHHESCVGFFIIIFLQALMNGRLSRPFHRVRVTERKKTRYSIALFSTPNGDYIIEPPKELVDEKHPRLFKSFTYVDLMSFYHTEAGRRPRSTLHAYCAVSGA